MVAYYALSSSKKEHAHALALDSSHLLILHLQKSMVNSCKMSTSRSSEQGPADADVSCIIRHCTNAKSALSTGRCCCVRVQRLIHSPTHSHSICYNYFGGGFVLVTQLQSSGIVHRFSQVGFEQAFRVASPHQPRCHQLRARAAL